MFGELVEARLHELKNDIGEKNNVAEE